MKASDPLPQDLTAPQGACARREDRRVVKTKAAICQSLHQLMKRQDYDTITVTAIAREADIDRKTFYTHYRTIDDVLEDIARQRLAAMLKEVDAATFFEDLEANTQAILQAINRNLKLDGLLESRDAPYPYERMLRLYTRLLSEWLNSAPTFGKGPAQIEETSFTVYYYLGGLEALYTRWLQSDRTLSLQELAQLAHRNIVYGAKGIVDKA